LNWLELMGQLLEIDRRMGVIVVSGHPEVMRDYPALRQAA